MNTYALLINDSNFSIIVSPDTSSAMRGLLVDTVATKGLSSAKRQPSSLREFSVNNDSRRHSGRCLVIRHVRLEVFRGLPCCELP